MTAYHFRDVAAEHALFTVHGGLLDVLMLSARN